MSKRETYYSGFMVAMCGGQEMCWDLGRAVAG